MVLIQNKNEISLKDCIAKHLNDIWKISTKGNQDKYIDDIEHFRVGLIRQNNEQFGYIDFKGNTTGLISIFNQKVLNIHGITIKLDSRNSNITYDLYINRELIETLNCPYSSLDIIINLKYEYKMNDLFRFLIKLNNFTNRNLY